MSSLSAGHCPLGRVPYTHHGAPAAGSINFADPKLYKREALINERRAVKGIPLFRRPGRAAGPRFRGVTGLADIAERAERVDDRGT